MSKLIFVYKTNKYEMTLHDKDFRIDLFYKYTRIINRKLEELLFFYKGKRISINNKKEINSFQAFKSSKNIIIEVFDVNNNNLIF